MASKLLFNRDFKSDKTASFSGKLKSCSNISAEKTDREPKGAQVWTLRLKSGL